jgi:hypothetical protein
MWCSCGKLGYWTRQSAKPELKRLRSIDEGDAQTLGIYRCPSGNELFHIGHANPNAMPADRNRPHVWFVEERGA